MPLATGILSSTKDKASKAAQFLTHKHGLDAPHKDRVDALFLKLHDSRLKAAELLNEGGAGKGEQSKEAAAAWLDQAAQASSDLARIFPNSKFGRNFRTQSVKFSAMARELLPPEMP